jgi:hypothetical protein
MTSPNTSTPTSGEPRSYARPEPCRHGCTPPATEPGASRLPSPSRRTPSSVGPHPTLEQHAAALTSALSMLASRMEQIGEGAEHLTCSETEAIIDVLVLSGHASAATALRDGHAGGDEDFGDMHHARWHELWDHDAERIHACCGDDGGDDLTDAIKEGRR